VVLGGGRFLMSEVPLYGTSLHPVTTPCGGEDAEKKGRRGGGKRTERRRRGAALSQSAPKAVTRLQPPLGALARGRAATACSLVTALG